MRSLEDARARWQVTTLHLTSLKDLKTAVKLDGDDSPSVAGLRSVCWKTFLLFQSTKVSEWPQALADSRSAYTALRGHLLRFLENSDELGSALDPLDDDRDSPWNTLRQDDEMRAEIFQDVERCMPEEPYFRQPETQRMLLDILFVFCKINQDVGYRQGMHELLAPILWVIDQDSVDAISEEDESSDTVMKQTLDQRYVEHDAFTLLSLVMRSAKSFYELGEPDKKVSNATNGSSPQPQGASPIVERSKRIHEVYLASVDPELAKHLTDIEILPQIFVIRWIRLLFGREFPFDELLAIWDTLFAEDPGLDLVDLVCVAMLLRIRWELMDSNYSFALMLLLKYPAPTSPNGPKTFVDDATFLRDNLTPVGGAAIIEKYSYRSPPIFSSSSPPGTPLGQATSPRQKLQRTKSPLPSPARFLQQQGVGDLFQGAARGLLDRGERLGINQAVRDAVVEAKKNMQGLQASRGNSFIGRTSSENSRWSLDEGKRLPSSSTMISSMNARNQKLAVMLEKAMSDLRAASASKTADTNTYIQAMELTIAKVEFVKFHLEDSTMPLPMEPSEVIPSSPLQSLSASVEPVDPLQTEPPHTTNPLAFIEVVATPATNIVPSEPPAQKSPIVPKPESNVVPPAIVPSLDLQSATTTSPKTENHLSARPVPLPTRSTIAQSNFAWMLEPDESSSSGTKSSPPKSSSPFLKSSRRPTSGASREKAAFLFGEDGGDSNGSSPRFPPIPDADSGFNLDTIRGSKSKSQE